MDDWTKHLIGGAACVALAIVLDFLWFARSKREATIALGVCFACICGLGKELLDWNAAMRFGAAAGDPCWADFLWTEAGALLCGLFALCFWRREEEI